MDEMNINFDNEPDLEFTKFKPNEEVDVYLEGDTKPHKFVPVARVRFRIK